MGQKRGYTLGGKTLPGLPGILGPFDRPSRRNGSQPRSASRVTAGTGPSPTVPLNAPRVSYSDESPVHSLLNLIQPSARTGYSYYDPNAPNYEPLPGDLQGPGLFGPSDNEILGQRQRLLDKLLAEIEGQDALDAANSQLTGVNAELTGLDDLITPQRKFAAYQPSGARPVRETIPFPERDTPAVNPGLALLSGILGVIRPEGAPTFAGGTLQGAVDRADRDYSDRMKKFGYAVDQANTRFADNLATYDERNAIDLANLRGSELTDFQNASGEYNRQLSRLPLVGQRASLESELGTPTQPGSLSRRSGALKSLASAGSDLAGITNRINSGLARNAAQTSAIQKDEENRLNRFKAVAPFVENDLKRRTDAEHKARELGLDALYKQGLLAVRNGELTLSQERLGVDRMNAMISLLDKGLMIDAKGRIVRDPDAPLKPSDGKQTPELTAAQKNTADVFTQLYLALKKENADLSEADIAARIFNSPAYKFARSMEADIAVKEPSLKMRKKMGAGSVGSTGAQKTAPNNDPLGIR